LNRSGQPFKTLMLTSAIPGEGKSTIINNLAVTFAQAGQDVVVVDCDMRRPVQHKLDNIPNRAGLSNILGQRLPLNEALQKTRFRNMQVITSGPLPPNPAELLGSLLMKPLLDQLALMYDIVLLDAPAMLPVVDSSVLAPIVDGVALVVRRNMVREEAVREACKQLELSNTNLIGLIVNDSELNGTYYYYHNR
jgi:capsular exopolysaccharide synthesis family protein